jgi:5-methyltetrahydrofolate--homocysteine methyltransferase
MLNFEAGADIVETNTFQVLQSVWLIIHYHIVYELNYESAKIAREVADAFTAKTQISPDLLQAHIKTDEHVARRK